MWFRTVVAISGGVALFFADPLRAQMHHVEAQQRVTRAVGVYEWTGDLPKPSAARFVPVSLFIEGRFEDAGLYLARPVPFALQTGNLYTVERSGEPEGALSLDLAQRVVSGTALADDNTVGAWYGYGKFTAEAAPKPVAPLHKSAHLGVIQGSSDKTSTAEPATDDGRPHMNRRSSTTQGDADKTKDNDTSAKGGANEKGPVRSSEDEDRPTLARRDPSQDASRKRASVGGRKAGEASVTAVGPQPGDDPDRPTLSRGTGAEDGPKELTGMPADLHQAVAVSDAASREPHPFARAWDGATERADTLAQMATAAKTRVSAYLIANKLVPAFPTAAAPPTMPQSAEGTAAATENGAGAPPKLQRGRPTEYGAGTKTPGTGAKTAVHAAPAKATHSPALKAAPLTLQDQQIAGYTLSYGGLPTFVYTASVPAAVAHPGDLPPAAARPTAFVTLVAQRLPSGDLQIALGAVTDSQHLDRSPRLHLVDAVDPDASHRASLLFEARSGTSRQFALYRLTSAKAENTFTSAAIE